jgi:arsenate reductase (glutaredoxin)
MSLRVYAYEKCDTCRKALRFLNERGIAHQVIPIREQPPTEKELRFVLGQVGELRRLFNTSGQDYRALGLGAKLAEMTEAEAMALLMKNGNLVKRPFVVSGAWGTTGFDAAKWAAALQGPA